jgi:hypothetical protein
MSKARLDKAVDDLERHTLAAIPGAVAKLVYLASTRDYNTGQYHHAGLEWAHTPEAAQAALQHCHVTVFQSLAGEEFEKLVEEVGNYLIASQGDPKRILKTWRGLEPYRMLVPAACDARIRNLFLANFSAALAVVQLKARRRDSQDEPQPQ